MSKLQKQISSALFVVLLLLVGLLLPHKPLTPSPKNITAVLGEVSQNDYLSNLQIEPESGKGFLLDAIKSSTKSINLAIYILSDEDILQALIDAQSRGVEVRVLLENNPFGGGNLNKISLEKLQSSGISVKSPPALIALLHQKSLIVDEKKLIILTLNLSDSAFTKNREYALIDEALEDVSDALGIFESDWNRTAYQSTAKQLVVSPDNAREKLTLLLQSGKNEIDIEEEVIEDEKIISLLSELAKKETVKVLLEDGKRVARNLTTGQSLKDHQVQVRYLSSPYLHAKLILVDRKYAYLGSVNLTAQSLDRNRELGIIFNNPDLISSLASQFDKDWEKGTE